jgi:hypothetical protein
LVLVGEDPPEVGWEVLKQEDPEACVYALNVGMKWRMREALLVIISNVLNAKVK